MDRPRRRAGGARIAVCVATSTILVACNREGRAAEQKNHGPDAITISESVSHARAESAVPPRTAPDGGAPDRGAPDGGAPVLIAHPDHIQAGLTAQRALAVVANPRQHDPRALEEGKQLFVSYNCADCHGGEGSGAMGPSLQDGRWHFGGTAGDVYESISEGRPDGMPSWGGRISDAQIWALVAYVRTLSSGKNVTTESFEGAGTVARGGH